jgi:hypothetical protein
MLYTLLLCFVLVYAENEAGDVCKGDTCQNSDLFSNLDVSPGIKIPDPPSIIWESRIPVDGKTEGDSSSAEEDDIQSETTNTEEEGSTETGFVCSDIEVSDKDYYATLELGPTDPCFDHVIKIRGEVCARLAVPQRHDNFLVPIPIDVMCRIKCPGVECGDTKNNLKDAGDVNGDALRDLYEFFINVNAEEDFSPVNESSFPTAIMLAMRFWPLLLAFVPIFLLNANKNSFGWFSFCCVSLFFLTIFEISSYPITFYLFVVVCLTFFGNVSGGRSARNFPESIVATLLVSQIMIFMFIVVHIWLHIFLIICFMVSTILIFIKGFESRNVRISSTMVLIGSLLPVLYEEMIFTMTIMERNPGFQVLKMTMNGFIPYGRAYLASVNIFTDAYRSYYIFGDIIKDDVHCVLALICYQILLFFGMRILLGYCMYRKMSVPGNIADCFWYFRTYASSLFSCINWCARNFPPEKNIGNEHFVQFISLVLIGLEVRYALDFFLIRVVFSIADVFWPEPGRIRVQSSAIYRINKHRVSIIDRTDRNVRQLRAFPTKGARDWTDIGLERLENIGDYLVKFVDLSNNYVGLGLMRNVGDGNKVVNAIRHVVESADAMVINGSRVNLHGLRKEANNSSDPVVELDGRHLEGPGFKMADIQSNMLGSIEGVCYVSDYGSSDPMFCYDNMFTIDKDEQSLNGLVNLRSGDSGAPVFASLANGDVRYAGAVSSGTHFGKPNICSLSCYKYAETSDSGGEGNAKDGAEDRIRHDCYTFNSQRTFDDFDFKCARQINNLSQGYIFVDSSMDDTACYFSFNTLEEYDKFMEEYTERFAYDGTHKAESKANRKRNNGWRRNRYNKYGVAHTSVDFFKSLVHDIMDEKESAEYFIKCWSSSGKERKLAIILDGSLEYYMQDGLLMTCTQ